MASTMDEAVAQLNRDPTRAVRARIGDMTVEVRAVVEAADRSAADVFAALGPWAGETTDELLASLRDARRRSRQAVEPGKTS